MSSVGALPTNLTPLEDLLRTELSKIGAELGKLEMELRGSAAASLAAGMIAATGRPHSVEEAVKLYQRVHYAIDRRYMRGVSNREIAERDHPLDKKHE